VTPQLVVSAEAAADIDAAVTWLGGISPNLPVRFEEELERVYASILDYPQIYPSVYKTFRRGCFADSRTPSSMFWMLQLCSSSQ
jgi:plasmid stabilization system protein ParE